jgi:glycosyltransferase involved in cell wall biosynthesis
MKIAQIVCVYPPYKGGIGESALNIARVLKSAGNEVKTFTIAPLLSKEGLGGGYGAPLLSKEGPGGGFDRREDDAVYLKAFPGLGNGGVLPRLCWRLKDFDLIYLHYPFFGTAEIIWFLKKFVWGKKKKLVIQYHMDAVLPNLFLKILSIPSALIFNSLFKNADLIISASLDYVANSKLKNIYQKYPQKFVEIPFGVDLNKFKPLETQQSPAGDCCEAFKILFVGGLDKAHYFKGVDVLLEAVAKISPLPCLPAGRLFKEGSGGGWQLEIVGDGDLRAKYEKKAQELNIADKIKFSGRVSDEDLPKKYQVADCFVLPSINKGEAFGIVLIEAMASGLPVIASDLPGVRGVFTPESGLKVKPGDVEDLAGKLKYLMINREIRKKMGEAARREAEEKYASDKIDNRLMEIINFL